MGEATQENLFKALGLFIEAMRNYVVDILQAQARDNWQAWYYESLAGAQQKHWELSIKSGTAPKNLIDFGNLKNFALKYKDLLKPDFGTQVNNLPTWLDDIAEVRNKCQHYDEIDSEQIVRTFSHMIIIMKKISLQEVEKEIIALRDTPAARPSGKHTTAYAGLIPWFKNVTPHLDIRQGHLDESIFAANLAEVAMGNGREIYQNPAIFFSKTCFTLGLKTVARRVVRGLNGGQDAENRVISLQTGFGGGKTHTLISLYHLAVLGSNAAKYEFLHDLLEFTGPPEFTRANIAVFTNTTNDPTQGRLVEDLHIKTLWGELAFQLGGHKAYALIRANDDSRTAPKGLFKQVLAMTKPALILIDELADYCVAASGVAVGSSTLADQTISFIQELSEAIASTDHCLLVATLPASVVEVASSPQASQILTSLSNRLGRVGADTRPVADEEIFEVIRRRLFEDLGDDDQIEKVISGYASMYQSLFTELPGFAVKSNYKEKLRKAYPFHPELIDMFRIHWASHHDFQRTRGVLRLLASIVADLWKRQGSLTGTNALIHTSDVFFENLDALCGQLKKLYGNGYDAVISADVSGTSANAFKIDDEKKEYGRYSLTQGIASTILLGSFGSTSANKGISLEEIKLCVLKPDSFNHNSINGALDAMEGHAHYLYYSTAGTTTKRYWFHTKPNINILINQAKNDIHKKDVNSEILRRLTTRIGGIALMNVLVNPAEDIPEQKRPTLVILGPQYLANPDEVNHNTRPAIEKIATKKGSGERIYRNTLLFLVCSEVGFAQLNEDLREYLACVKIRDEYQGQLETEQKDDIRRKIEEFNHKAGKSLVSAYSLLIKYSAKDGLQKLLIRQFKDTMEMQINTHILQLLKDEEWLLEAVGLGTLRKNNLFPAIEQPIRTKDIYEAFIRFDDKPMITGIEAIRDSLLRYCFNGEFAIATGDGKNFTRIFYKENPPYFDVENAEYWIVDKSLYSKPEEPQKPEQPQPGKEPKEPSGSTPTPPAVKSKSIKAITISGKVDMANYNQIFTSFIVPLAQNNVEIEVRIKGKSTNANPLSETSQQYKVTKESAGQLGLKFEEEE